MESYVIFYLAFFAEHHVSEIPHGFNTSSRMDKLFVKCRLNLKKKKTNDLPICFWK